MLWHTLNRLQNSVSITSVWTGKLKHLHTPLYCHIPFIGVVWNPPWSLSLACSSHPPCRVFLGPSVSWELVKLPKWGPIFLDPRTTTGTEGCLGASSLLEESERFGLGLSCQASRWHWAEPGFLAASSVASRWTQSAFSQLPGRQSPWKAVLSPSCTIDWWMLLSNLSDFSCGKGRHLDDGSLGKKAYFRDGNCQELLCKKRPGHLNKEISPCAASRPWCEFLFLVFCVHPLS